MERFDINVDNCDDSDNDYLKSELRIAKRVYEDFISFRENFINGHYTAKNEEQQKLYTEITNSFIKYIDYNLSLLKGIN